MNQYEVVVEKVFHSYDEVYNYLKKVVDMSRKDL